MPLALSVVAALAVQCAPVVAPETLMALAHVESGLEPLAIGVNGPAPYRILPSTREAAIATAHRLIEQGANVDLGLLQINVRNLGWLGLTVDDTFDPCRNLNAAGRVLRADYRLGLARGASGQAALRVAFSYYSTGRADRGFRNGYVARVTAAAGAPLPKSRPAASKAVIPPAWAVFAIPGAESFVITPTPAGDAP